MQTTTLDAAETRRRLPTLELIESDRVRAITTRLSSDAPEYFWTAPASSSNYHHPACRGEHGLWIHTLMLSTVIERLADSYVGQDRLERSDVDLAHAAAILHDQRKLGDPASASESSTSDHDLEMAAVVRDSPLDNRVADAIASHMGAWYDGPEPSTDLEDLVHTADMVSSTSTISPGIHGPLPDELEGADAGLDVVDLS